ncbi:SURF1 family protein [Brevibacterium album]|uniref:SURF1 family cytochrome oxidase biogenesis protein n=1 Tax=Brevibacterium album TaxID=417948 RepID=UPI00040EDF97|nr:SURF1 family protein [Brevibacterium album]
MRFLFTRRWLQYIGLAVVAAIACGLLANWQNQRRESRDAEIERIEAHYSAAPVPLETVLGSPDAEFGEEADWTRVSAQGSYRPEETVLVRNRPKDGRAGFWELVPFETDQGATLLIARGWIAGSGAEAAASDLPAPPDGEVAVTAWLRPAQDGDASENTEASAEAVGSVRAVDPGLILAGSPGAYDHAYGYLEAEDPAAAAPVDALPAPDTDPGSHLSYTFQWIAFGIMILAGVAYAAKRERDAVRRGERGPDAAGTGDAAGTAAGPEAEYVVVDKAALLAGARGPDSRRPGRDAAGRPARSRKTAKRRTREAEELEDAALDRQLR